jgi:hypothetical protein
LHKFLYKNETGGKYKSFANYREPEFETQYFV